MYQASRRLATSMPTAPKMPPAIAWPRRTGVLGTYRYSAVSAAAISTNSVTSSRKPTPPGNAPTSPREADSTYEVMLRLPASSSGPSVIAAQ